MNVKKIQEKLKRFAEERDWEQFHSPKNLAMALGGEAGELMEVFQWMTEEQSRAITERPADHSRAAEELADIIIYALRLADKADISIADAVDAKIARNAEKYPVESSKGSAEKYNRRY